MRNMIVTTSVKTTLELNDKAQKLADELNLKYIKRNKSTIKQLLGTKKGVIVVYKNKLSYFENNSEFFFHLDTTALKIKNSDNEPLVEIIGKEKQSILDCTMGLAGDSILLSYYGHTVTSIEKNKIIHLITSNGLENYVSPNEKINKAMRKITTYNYDCIDYLKKAPDNTFDIIYFDPMFSHNIRESENLSGITPLADKNFRYKEFIKEASRVGKDKIIIKAHFRDNIFEKYNFTRIIRKNTKFHFGFLEINKKTKN
jgi:SAM-dependent methyltransferase